MNCKACGELLESGSNFCGNCGAVTATDTSNPQTTSANDEMAESVGKRKSMEIIKSFIKNFEFTTINIALLVSSFLLVISLVYLVAHLSDKNQKNMEMEKDVPSMAVSDTKSVSLEYEDVSSGKGKLDDELKEGIYTIFDVSGSFVLNLSAKNNAASDKNGTEIIMWTPTNSKMQSFRIAYDDNGTSRIFPLSSSEGHGRALTIEPKDNIVGADINVVLWEDSIAKYQQWTFVKDHDEYYKICYAEDPDLILGYKKPAGKNIDCRLYNTNNSEVEKVWRLVYVGEAAPAVANNPATSVPDKNNVTTMPSDIETFILQLNQRYIETYELQKFSQEQIGYIRNGVFALSGKIFSKAGYRNYFSDKSWYYPISDNDEYVTQSFNSFQKRNLVIITTYETEMGWRK